MSGDRYRLPWYKSLFRFFFRPVFRFIFKLLGPIEIVGKENIPKKGAYLVVFNHVSLYDAPLLVAIWPRALEALGAQDIWSRPGQNILVRGYGAIPVLRGEIDREAVTKILGALRSGRPLIMAPEGGRSHGEGMRQAKSGVVYFIEATGVPVVPVGVEGTQDDYYKQGSRGKRPRVVVTVGQPFHLPEDIESPAGAPRDLRQMKADYIMRRIARLLPEDYRGYYT
jgi:1-acyl-sn-glycerol-3-phosphate acyltransferase